MSGSSALLVLFVTAFWVVYCQERMNCPPEKSIPKCWCMERSYLFRGPYVRCSDVKSVEDLRQILKGLRGNPVEALHLYNASLPYFPRNDGLFKGTHIEYLWLDTSKFKSFAPHNTMGPSPFAGLEKSLKQVKLEGLLQMESVDWRELHGLGLLTNVEISRCKIGGTDSSFSALPASVQRLNLFDGQLTRLSDGAFNLPNLTSVSIVWNQIPRLKRSIFSSRPSRLTDFSFRLNKVKNISEDFFANLPALTFADISSNSLMTLPSSLKDNWGQLESIYLAGNPLLCDCKSVWLLRAAKNRPPKYSDLDFVTCAAPQRLAGRTLLSLQEDDFCP